MTLTQSAPTFSSIRESLSNLCKYYGSRPDLVQAGGGNISIKYSNELLFIKSSGCTLFDVEPNKNISVVSLYKVNKYNNSTDRECVSEKEFLKSSTISGDQPSLETFFHAKAKKYTVHLHPVVVVLALEKYKDKLISEYNGIAEFVNYYRPGLELSDKISGEKKIIFLDKHGIIVHSNDFSDLTNTIESIISFCSSLVCFDMSVYNTIEAIQNDLFLKYGELYYVMHTDVDLSNLRKTPDCVIYSGGFCGNIENKYDKCPSCMSVNGYNFIIGKSFLRCKQIEEVLQMYSSVTTELSISDVNNLLHWDSEKYRQVEH